MDMYTCPLWDGCSAPICPLDTGWQDRSHLDGERVCYYLTEYSKEAARPILRGGLDAEHFEAIADLYPEIRAAHPRIRRQLDRSSRKPPRCKSAAILKQVVTDELRSLESPVIHETIADISPLQRLLESMKGELVDG